MPDYLTQEEYLERYGLAETIRITDEANAGVVDAEKLATAISDATEWTENYLRVRYDLPLASVPSSIKGLIAALAREALHRTRPLQAVTEAADRARQLLRDISIGRVVLALEDGEEVASGGGLAVWSQAAEPRIFNSEKLDGF